MTPYGGQWAPFSQWRNEGGKGGIFPRCSTLKASNWGRNVTY